ncbi:hypothetical protein DYB25_002763 [Aphanomyces astaci]|uniref:HSF-type DNA-binding domain-containing protein n=1 Tax=Aphanomyces astaci TaxID=112090 RepID=A0A397BBE7_APHAT|nr:hypothetical protein DYB25_002763 [Aphanomyces astaci]RHY16230.1 hypothetical protein DYB36_006513 [Aphanomyces astaci]
MASSIATGFVRKLYRMLEEEDASIIGWEPSGTHFTIRDEDLLNSRVLLKYYRGKLTAFRQQLLNHGFERDGALSETYVHPCFVRGNPAALSQIVFAEKPKIKVPPRKASTKKDATKAARPEPYPTRKPANIQLVPGSEEDVVWKFLINVCYSDDKLAFNPASLTSNPGFTPSMVQLTIDDATPAPCFDGPNPLFAPTAANFGSKSSSLPPMLAPPASFQVLKPAPPLQSSPAASSLFAPPSSTSRLVMSPTMPPSSGGSLLFQRPLHSTTTTIPAPPPPSLLFQPPGATAITPPPAVPTPLPSANPLFSHTSPAINASASGTNPLFDKSATPTGFGALPLPSPNGLPSSMGKDKPLFMRDNSLGGDQWQHLVSTSVDRFMKFSDTFDSPEDTFKFVLEERQRLGAEKTKLAPDQSTGLFSGLANQGPDALISFLMTSSMDLLQKSVDTFETNQLQQEQLVQQRDGHTTEDDDDVDDEWEDGDDAHL